MKRIIGIVLLLMFIIGCFGGDMTPKSSRMNDFQIVSLKGVWRDDRLRAVGEVRNNGDIAMGVQIQLIARDKNGEIVESQKIWPNSITNIQPGRTCSIEYTVTRDRRAVGLEGSVIDVKVWR